MGMSVMNNLMKKVVAGKPVKQIKENLKNKKEEKGESKKCKTAEKKSGKEKC